MLTTYVALFRGVNVGGKNKLPMKELAEIFTQAGCSSARTYIQSGNVIFHASPDIAAKVPGAISARIEERYGHKPPILLRSEKQLGEAIRANPFSTADEPTPHLFFLAAEPDPALVEKLDPNRSPPDRFHVRGAHVYMCLPNGLADTKLTNSYFDTKLSTISTGRNWRIVLMLHELMQKAI